MSITVKFHGGEYHLVLQMRASKVGLFEFDESWTEQYHQKGYHFDMKLCNLGSEKRKAIVRAGNKRRENHHATQARLARLLKYNKGKRNDTIEKEEARKKAKTERRKNSLNKV